ncbi:zinc finger protein 133 [Moniliophthora roreri]|nr:zinc finger protein 133 [Moniliophthora roreri]
MESRSIEGGPRKILANRRMLRARMYRVAFVAGTVIPQVAGVTIASLLVTAIVTLLSCSLGRESNAEQNSPPDLDVRIYGRGRTQNTAPSTSSTPRTNGVHNATALHTSSRAVRSSFDLQQVQLARGSVSTTSGPHLQTSTQAAAQAPESSAKRYFCMVPGCGKGYTQRHNLNCETSSLAFYLQSLIAFALQITLIRTKDSSPMFARNAKRVSVRRVTFGGTGRQRHSHVARVKPQVQLE